jgi:zinc transport system substrate-binding protein
MNNKQKILLLTITLIIVISVSAVTFVVTAPKPTDNINIVATFYPLAYLSEQIGGDHVTVTQLVPDNTEIHTWQPSASHIVATEDADIIVYNGAGADHWMEDDIIPALSTSKSHIVLETTSGLELIANQEHEHEGEETGEEEHDHGEYDPHTWLSPYMAKQQAEKIYNALVQADPNNKDYYTQNWQTLESKLTELDTQYSQSLSNTNQTVIFVSHEAFGYLAARYSFEQHGVIGLSADEQPSTTTIATLVEEMIEHGTYTVYVDPVYSSDYAQTIKTEVEAKTGHTVSILNLYLMLGPNNGMDYLEQMQANLDNLENGLAATQ